MNQKTNYIAGPDDRILITGATGFIGSKVVENLVDRGFHNLRCLVRPSSGAARTDEFCARFRNRARIETVPGNLLSRDNCITAAKDVAVIIHLAAARGEKSFPDAFMNSVVTTRNLLEGALCHGMLRRFVNVSSFAVYTNTHKPQGRLLDERCPVESYPERQGSAYTFAKAKQDEIVTEYGRRFGIPFVIVRPGYVYGAGNTAITGRVGIDTFGVFLHMGGSNPIPLTYVDNCADAITRAALVQAEGIDGEVFNVVDDDLPSSRQFLRMYKRHVRRFTSFYVPHAVSYALCYAWERYASWSEGQLPPAFNRKRWHSVWKKTRYSNSKLKSRLDWAPTVSTSEGLTRYFEACRLRGEQHA
jgi:nucleoside-diphosphate-sugar epimerase